MLESQKLAIRASEIRSRLAEIAGIEGDLPDEVKTETVTLRNEYTDVEVRFQAAATSEDVTETVEPVSDQTAEQKEVIELRAKSSVVNYVQAAVEMRSLDGPEAEFNSALKMGSHQFPVELLAPEKRQTTAVDVAANQGTWVDRLFNGTAAQHIGVTFQAVGPGVLSLPVTTAGATAAQLDKSGAAAAAAWTVGITEMKPKRNAVHAIFSIEDAARIGPGLEDALTRDLRMAMIEGIDRVIFKGDLTPTSADADIIGLQTAPIAEFTLTQSNKVKGTNVLAALAAFVDGKHAVSPADIRIVASVGSNVLWMTTVQSAVENQTLAQFLRDSGISWSTRGGIDTNTANGDFGAYVGLGQGIAGAAVSATWMAGQLLADPYSGSKKGEVSLVLNTLHDFAVPRPSNFKRLKYVT